MTAGVHFALFTPAALGGLLMLLATGWTLRDVQANTPESVLGWKWWLLCALAVLCFRWPLLFVQHQLNPDESQLIAGAITLRHDPVFWRSVDGNTGGPLDYYPLFPAAWVTGPSSFVVARLIGLAVTFAALLLAGETLALLAGASLARVVVLPALAAAAFTTCPDFVFYSSETMPTLLLAAAAYAAVRQGRTPAPGWLWATALLLGGVPWTKLQAVPLAAVLWLLVVIREYRAGRTSSLLPLLIGGLLPTLFCAGFATISGQWENLYVPYVLQNVVYVGDPHFSWTENAAQQGLNAFSDGYLGFWLAGAAGAALVIGSRYVRSASPATRRLALAALGLFAVAVYSALAPRRPSAHHLQFLVVPWVWLTGAVLALAWTAATDATAAGRRRWVAISFLACTLVPLGAWRLAGHDAYAGMNADVLSPARQRLSLLVDRYSAPGETLAIWGWRCSLYVEAGRPQATRQAHTEPQIHPGPFQGYYLRRYFDDFRAANAPVFADAVGPGGFAFTDRDRAHECFPPLRAWVRDHYTQIADLDGTRLYVRNDRLTAGNSAHRDDSR